MRITIQDLSESIIDIYDDIDYIVHLANTSESGSLKNEGIQASVNAIISTENLLGFAKKKKCHRLLYLSSITVYGESNEVNQAELVFEEDYFRFDWLLNDAGYVNSKRFSEFLFSMGFRTDKVACIIIRPGFVYGFNPFKDERIYAKALTDALNGDSIVIKSSGYLYRDSIYVVDLIKAILVVLSEGKSGEIYNATNGAISLREYVDTVSRITGTACRYEDEEQGTVRDVQCHKKYAIGKIEELGYRGMSHKEAIRSSIRIGKAWLMTDRKFLEIKP